MKKYDVIITETLKKTVEVEAESQEEAEQTVINDWNNGAHILDADCFDGVVFEAKENTSSKIKVVLLEPGKLAREAEIDATLKGMQSVVGGYIEPLYFCEEPVCFIVNEEGKILNLELNRGVYDKDKKLIEIIAGTAFICDCSGKNFGSLSSEQVKKFTMQYKYPEKFFRTENGIKGFKYNPLNKEHER